MAKPLKNLKPGILTGDEVWAKIIADYDAGKPITRGELLAVLTLIGRTHEEFGRSEYISIPAKLLRIVAEPLAQDRRLSRKGNENKSAQSKIRKGHLQVLANEIWKSKPDLSRKRVGDLIRARLVAGGQEDPPTAGTIRRIIIKKTK